MAAILEIKDLTKKFGGLVANSGITFNVEKGSIVGVVGPNGAGKTTMFNSISRAHSITAGSVVFDGVDISKHKSYEVCQMGMGRTYQIPQTLNDMTVLENIMVGALCHRNKVSDAMAYAVEISEFCGLSTKNAMMRPWRD